jgi:uncharacterized protein YchJ
MATINITNLVAKYIAARDMKAKLDAAHKTKLEPLVAAMEKTEAAILDFFNKHGIDNAKCEAGTAFKASRTSATVNDMDAFLAFVKENEAWHFLEKRVAKTQVDEYVEAHKDLPPGISYTRMAALNVRRAS